ncbi:MAG: ParA family protein [Halobacteriaceae archaeon]
MPARTVAVVGAAGGVGATRLTVEMGATLARAGSSVALFDAAFATQGLARHVEGRLDPDATAVLADDAALEAALVDHAAAADLPGSLAVAPAHAPFGRVAMALAPSAGERFSTLLADHDFDAAVVDVPPVASNPAVAAVTAADRVVVVTTADGRGLDALQQQRGRLADVGAACDVVVANRESGETPPDADHAVPTSDVTAAADAPAVLDDRAFARAVADVTAAAFDVDADIGPDGSLLDDAWDRLS